MPGIKRPIYLNKVKPYLGQTHFIKVITGMRRSGKSYFLRQLLEELKDKHSKSKFIFIDKESLDFEDIQDHKSLNQYVKSKMSKRSKNFLFIDEVQEIKDWEKAIRSFYNSENFDIYITGSNSDTLSSELSTHLTGRYVEVPIYTLNFQEFLKFRSKKAQNQTKEFENFLRFGGLPSIHLLELDEEAVYSIIKAIYNTVLLKDVIKKYEVRNAALLENIARFAFTNLGSNISAANISKYLKAEKISAGNDTIQNYLNYICNAYLLNKVKNFDIKGKKIFAINDKYFANDLGIKNAVLGYRAGDIAGSLENIVFHELRVRGYDVFVGRLGDYEVDFIAQKREQKIYIQVAYLIEKQETLERELRPLLQIQDNHPKYLVTMDQTPNSNHEGIERINIIDFLLGSW